MLIDLVSRQQRAGFRPMLCHFDHPYFDEQCRKRGIQQLSPPPRALFKHVRTLPRFAMQFARIIRSNEIHLVHSHLFGPIVGGSIAAFLARVPHVGTLHDIHMIEDSPRRIRQLDIALLLGTKLAAVSAQMREYYRHRVAWRKDSIVCIRNGIEPFRGTAISREELKIPSSATVVACVGRLVALKRVQDAIEAVAQARSGAPVFLLVVGEGPELPALRSKAKELGISEHVHFLGNRQDVAALLPLADIFIQCSETEGLSMSIIEAIHAGLPCIVTNVGGNPELIQHDDNGALVSVGDTGSMSDWITALSRDPNRRELMGSRSKQIALEHFTGDSCAAQYTHLYSQLGVHLER